MNSFNRTLDLKSALEKKSHFLFGARGSGKTSLIQSTFESSESILHINLLKTDLKLRLIEQPSLLRSWIAERPKIKTVIIDEIQKVPDLLDEVHLAIEEKKIHFLLTGSSARKIKKGAANLLGGRARILNLNPLCSAEIPDFNLTRYLNHGGLPAIYLSDDPYDDLQAYIQSYLNEEIASEALVRNLIPFTRFLKTSSLMHSNLINYAALASDAQINETTVRSYFEILSDTLIAKTLEPWTQSKKRKAIQTSKFYFFDIGVLHALLNIREVNEKTETYGRAFESFIFQELTSYNQYKRLHLPFTYWRSVNKQEVDFCLGEKLAIEVKAKTKISHKDLSGLKAIHEEGVFKKLIVVCMEPLPRKIGNIEVLPLKLFLDRLWGGDLI
jgi:predicted AAA+ superfamily ATPase